MRRDNNVYVIRLKDAVLRDRRFKGRNQNHRIGKPCVYVGMTHWTPQERFNQHRAGYKSSRYVKMYGHYLMPKHYSRLNPMTHAQAEKEEVALARRLRARGYAVWQN
jgi:hypothetical protein